MKLLDDIKETYTFSQYAYEMEMTNHPPIRDTVFTYVGCLRDVLVGKFVCRRHGHKFEDAGSYATPDSGAEHLHCTRCNYEFDHIYY